MALFFRNPVLGRLEGLLWEKGRQRYIEEGGSVPGDIEQLSRDVRSLLKRWVNEWCEEENKKLKPIWREFKRQLADQTSAALAIMMKASNQDWYAVEVGELQNFPEVLAVPCEVLKKEITEEVLPWLLAKKIEFEDMLPETRRALAKYAIERNFDRVVSRARKQYQNFLIGERYDHFVIVDVIERDFYHLGDRTDASRVDMVILGAFRENITDRDKSGHTAEKQTIKKWSKQRKNRRDDRRFSGKGWWHLDQAALEKMARG